MEKAIVAWSGGKDSALALHGVQEEGFKIAGLLTTVTAQNGRISMHGVRRTLLQKQCRALGLPLQTVSIPPGSSNERYEAGMASALEAFARQGVTSVVFGDIFLDDIRAYRERQLSKIGLKACFPLWKKHSLGLAQEFLALGFKAIITCVDSNVLAAKHAGRRFEEGFLAGLPSAVDPSGENGEFHTFVYDGPNFFEPVLFTIGKVAVRDDRFFCCDLMTPRGRGSGFSSRQRQDGQA